MEDINNAQVNCPYCGALINNNVEFCPNCKEWFCVPELSGFKYISISGFLIFAVLCEAFKLPLIYSLVWIALNFNYFVKLAIPKDLKKFKILFILFVVSVFGLFLTKFFAIVAIVFEMLICHRMLRIIEKYTLKKYGSPISHHEIGMLLFRTLYVIYYIDTYAQRVKDPSMRYCLNIDKWIKYIAIISVIVIILYMVGFLTIPFIK